MEKLFKRIRNKYMKIEVDKESGAAYIYITNNTAQLSGPLRSDTINADLVIDYSEDGKIFGIEILNLKLLDLSDKNINFIP